MKIEIKLDAKKEPFFIERRRITSGRIARSGFEEYGVVFSGIGKPNEVSEEPPADLTAAESDFQVAHLQSAMVGWRSASDFDDHLYFEILGGYFYHQGNEKDGQTSKVFGIASEPAFGVKENGKTTINDNWALVEPSTRGLDEKEGRGGGWTFIVRWKDGGEFPTAAHSLKFVSKIRKLNWLQLRLAIVFLTWSANSFFGKSLCKPKSKLPFRKTGPGILVMAKSKAEMAHRPNQSIISMRRHYKRNLGWS